MKLKITNENQNPVFNRREIQGIIESDIAPKKQEAAKALAEKCNASPDALRILSINGKFGSKTFDFKANVYSSKEERDNLEHMSKKEKEAEASATETPAEPAALAETSAESAPAQKPEEKTPAEEPAKTPAEEAIGVNPVEEAKKAEDEKAEEDKKEKEKTEEEKQLEK